MTNKVRLLIAYDLKEQPHAGSDYSGLYSALDSLGAKRIQESVWVVRTSESPNALSLQLQKLMHTDDRLLVTRIGEFTSHKGINRIRPI